MACEEHKAVLLEISTLKDRLEKTENQTAKNTDDIQELRRHKVSNEEKFERVFELLGELKDSIKEIKIVIEKKNERLPSLVYSVAGMAIGGALSGIIVWLITR